ncbi:MAG: sulfatase [Pseudomonadota bacterium]
MMRKGLMGLSVMLALAVAGCGEEAAKRQSEGPANIVLIVANDLSPAQISPYGGAIPTPNLDRLASEGVLFTKAYAAAPYSGPSRAGLLTGRHPAQFGYQYDNGPGMRDAQEGLGLPVDEPIVAEELAAAGYATGGFGVWHLGGLSRFHPLARGFDSYFGVLTGYTPYLRPSSEGFVFAPTPGIPIPPARGLIETFVVKNVDADDIRDDEFFTDTLARKADAFIRAKAAAGEKFFLYLPFNAPHTPLTAPRRWHDKFADIDDEKARVYAALVATMDEAVGRVLAALDEAKVARNTLVIFTSATGCDGETGLCSCTASKGGKGSVFEGGLNMPLILRWPAQAPQGERYDGLVSLMDVAPTIRAAAGLPAVPSTLDSGRDLMPYLTVDARGAPHRELFWAAPPVAAVLSEDWKLIHDAGTAQTLLYDLRSDPAEAFNLAATRQDRLLDLRAILDPRVTSLPAALWPPRRLETREICGVAMTAPE